MVGAVVTRDIAMGISYDTFAARIRARAVDPATLQGANQHDQADTPGAGSSSDGHIAFAAPYSIAIGASFSTAGPQTKAAPPVSPEESRRQAAATRAAVAPFPTDPGIRDRNRRRLCPKLWVSGRWYEEHACTKCRTRGGEAFRILSSSGKGGHKGTAHPPCGYWHRNSCVSCSEEICYRLYRRQCDGQAVRVHFLQMVLPAPA